MWDIKLFEKEDTPKHIHVGLRTIKTVIAVFLCALIGLLRGEPTFFSMIAAIACMQNTTGKTVETAFNQVMGTIIGAAFGLVALYVELLTGMDQIMVLYYLMISLLIIPIILITLVIRKPSISSFSCVVFLSVAIHQLDVAAPWVYALQRTCDILIGVVISFLINLIPHHTPSPAGDGGEGH